MRIRKGYCHVAPPPDLVSSSTTSNQLPSLIVSRINLSSFSSNLPQNPRTGVVEEEEPEADEGSTTKNKSSIRTTQTSSATTSSVSSLFSHHEWWCEEEKNFPLKKRRISLERFTTREYCRGGQMENAKKIKNKEVVAKEIKNAAAKEDGSNIIMSLRCSRKDGKGWRCRNKRVEGYSMCEHHIKSYPRFRDASSNIGNNKKRKMRKMMLSSILERTVPLV